MARTKQNGSQTIGLLAGFVLGGLAVYFLDPTQGRRRRTTAVDRGVHLTKIAANRMRNAIWDINNRFTGWLVVTSHRFETSTVPDDRLLRRVRSEIGRFTRHPRSIQVFAENGVIKLRGVILASEVKALFDHVRRIRGVRHVENQLEVHTHAEHVPGLQGDGHIHPQGATQH